MRPSSLLIVAALALACSKRGGANKQHDAAAARDCKRDVDAVVACAQDGTLSWAEAAHALGETGSPDAVPHLLDILPQGGKPRLVAIRALGKLRDPRAVDPLIAIVQAPAGEEPPSYEAAIAALATIRDPRAVPALVLALVRAPGATAELRTALVAFGSIAAEEMRRALRHEHPEIEAAYAEIRKERACDPASATSCEGVTPIEHYAALVLGDLHDAEAASALFRAIDVPGAEIAILDALAAIGHPLGGSAAVKVLARPDLDDETRAAAARAFAWTTPAASTLEEACPAGCAEAIALAKPTSCGIDLACLVGQLGDPDRMVVARALLGLRARRADAAPHVEDVLVTLARLPDDPLVREVGLHALAMIAPRPCEPCAQRVEALISPRSANRALDVLTARAAAYLRST